MKPVFYLLFMAVAALFSAANLCAQTRHAEHRIMLVERDCETPEQCRALVCYGSQAKKEKTLDKLIAMGKDGIKILVELLGDSYPPEIGDRTPAVHEQVHSRFWKDRKTVTPILIELMKDRDSRVRENAVGALMSVDVPAETIALLEALKDSSDRVREKAASWLGDKRSQAKDVVPALIKALNDTDRVREKAAKVLGLGYFGSEANSAVPALIEALNSPDSYLRENVVETLGNIGAYPQETVPALIRSLKDPDTRVRENAIIALGKFGAEAKPAAPALAKFLADTSSEIRKRAAGALGAIGPGAEKAVPELIRSLKDVEKDVRDSAATTLEKIGSASVPALMELLKNPNGDWQLLYNVEGILAGIGAPAVPLLLESLKDSDGRIRLSAADTLGKLGPPAKIAAPALTELLDGAGNDDRYRVIGALWEIEPPTIPEVIKSFKDSSPYVRGMAAMKLRYVQPAPKDAVPALMEALRDDDSTVRSYAAQALGSIGSKDAVPALIELLKNNDILNRVDAALALGQIGPEAKDAVPALKEAQKDTDEMVRKKAVEAIAEITQEIKPRQ